MNSLDRCLAVLHHLKPDKVPIVPQSFMFAVEMAGYRIGQVTRNATKMAEAHLNCIEKFGYDGIVIDFDDASLAEACGAKVIYRDDEPAIVNESIPLINDLNHLDELRLPNPNKDGRLSIWLETTEILTSSVGSEVMVMGRADQGPFSLATLLRGTENFMMDLIAGDPEQLHQLIEYCRKACAIFAKAQKEAGAHITSIGDAFAGPNLISPEMYRQFAWRPEKLLTREVQDTDIPFSIHICGNTQMILDDMIDTGADLLEIDWQVDMQMALEKAKRKCAIMGNINPSDPMVTGSVIDVRKATLDLLNTTGGYGLILSTGCAMGRNTPQENFSAFIEAARSFELT